MHIKYLLQSWRSAYSDGVYMWFVSSFTLHPVHFYQVLTDLTTVLECLFWLLRVHGEASEVDAKFVGLAVAAQSSSGARSRIHEAIRSFVTAASPFKRKGKDEALSLITNLIHAVKFKPEEVGQGDSYRLSMTISEFSVSNVTNDQLVMTSEESSSVSRRWIQQDYLSSASYIGMMWFKAKEFRINIYLCQMYL